MVPTCDQGIGWGLFPCLAHAGGMAELRLTALGVSGLCGKDMGVVPSAGRESAEVTSPYVGVG